MNADIDKICIHICEKWIIFTANPVHLLCGCEKFNILFACLSSAFIMWYDIYFVAHRNEVSSEHWYPHIFQSKVCLVFIDKNLYAFIDKKTVGDSK